MEQLRWPWLMCSWSKALVWLVTVMGVRELIMCSILFNKMHQLHILCSSKKKEATVC